MDKYHANKQWLYAKFSTIMGSIQLTELINPSYTGQIEFWCMRKKVKEGHKTVLLLLLRGFFCFFGVFFFLVTLCCMLWDKEHTRALSKIINDKEIVLRVVMYMHNTAP